MTSTKNQLSTPARRRLPPEQQTFLDLVKTYGEKMFALNALLRPHGLTEPQYNVLRILRGAGRSGLTCGQIAERMLTRLPDITRLLDRLAGEDYVTRSRSQEDRRKVFTQITSAGLELLARLDAPVRALHIRQFSGLSKAELQQLQRLLRKSRGT